MKIVNEKFQQKILIFVWLRGQILRSDLFRSFLHQATSFLCLKITPQFYIFNNKIKMDDIECVFESVSGCGSLFISNHSAAQNLQLLQSKGIRAILSVARSGLVSHKREDIPHYLYIPAQDHEEYLINRHFELTYDFIEKARKETNVLIHCMAGISRSVTIVIAYLLKRYKHTLGQVVTMVQRRRKKINPNKGFIEQLKKYSSQLGIRCDFQGESISPLRDSSASKQIRAYSAKKYQSSIKRSELFHPDLCTQKIIRNDIFSEKIITHIEEIASPQINNQVLELKKIKSYEIPCKINQCNEQNGKNDLEQKKLLELKKSISVDFNNIQKKKSKIQEKISKIRERLLKNDEFSRKDICKSMQGIYVQNKQNKNMLKKENIHAAKQPTSPSQDAYRPTTHKQTPKSAQINYKQLEITDFCPEIANENIYSSCFKIEPKIYSSSRGSGRVNSRLRQQINT